MKIAVIGGAGGMGQWLLKYFKRQGHNLVISDVNGEKAYLTAKTVGGRLAENNKDAVMSADLVVVCVPVESTSRVIDEVSSNMNVGSVLMEVASVKKPIIQSLKAAAKYGLHPVSIHPLFGPGAEKLENLRIALIPVIEPAFEEGFIREIFPGADIVVVDADRHDRMMAVVLSLPYFVNLALTATIAEEDIGLLKRLSGTTFTMQLLIMESILSQDTQLHTSIHFNNKETENFLEKFMRQANRLKALINKQDKKSFEEFYEAARRNLRHDKDFFTAYRRMYILLEKLANLE